MNHYLLFNDGCGSCSQIANQIEEKVGGVLKVRSLTEVEIQAILNKARPGWKWEPMLLDVCRRITETFRCIPAFSCDCA